jgi:predicted O-methyltransferase YrrM
MNKIKKLLKAVALILKEPALLNKVLDDEDVNRKEVIQKFNLPFGLKTIAIEELFPEFTETVSPFAYLDGGSTPIDIALLKKLAQTYNGCAYFEIGTWRGESVANVAQVAKHCTTLNLPDDVMLTMGLDKAYVNLHRFFSASVGNITHIQANSQSFNFNAFHQQFDLVFIDGDHHYESVKTDTSNAFKLLKNNDSIIVWHDYGNTPNNIRWDVLRGILEGCPESKRKYLYRVSNTLCAIYTTKPLTAYQQEKFETPQKNFNISIKIEKN